MEIIGAFILSANIIISCFLRAAPFLGLSCCTSTLNECFFCFDLSWIPLSTDWSTAGCVVGSAVGAAVSWWLLCQSEVRWKLLILSDDSEFGSICFELSFIATDAHLPFEVCDLVCRHWLLLVVGIHCAEVYRNNRQRNPKFHHSYIFRILLLWVQCRAVKYSQHL